MLKSNLFKKTPIHSILFSIYFPITLLSVNLGEIKPITVFRSIIGMLLLVGVILFLSNLHLKDGRKAGLAASLGIISLSTYGLLYVFFKNSQFLNPLFGRHRIMIVLILVIYTALYLVLTNIIKNLNRVTQIANLFSIYLILIPLAQILLFIFQIEIEPPSRQASEDIEKIEFAAKESLPDIYFIILDAYDRADYLATEFNFDNSLFIDKLRDTGFYVADCSRSNYAHTFLSLSSTLNMDYVANFMADKDVSDHSLKNALVNSKVRENLSGKGYQVVTFDNVHWDSSNADIFYEFKTKPILNPYLFPIETVLINNSILKLVMDISPKFQELTDSFSASAVKDHYLQQLFILDSLEDSISIPSPKFVFAHVEKPHGPYVFEPNGEFIEEDAFYRDKYFAAINEEYDKYGYTKQIRFLNRRMERFIEVLLGSKAKDVNAIIIIQGDHGIQENEDLNSRLTILNAVYLPGQNYSLFHSGITPVNTFRIIHDQFFSTDMGLIEDQSFYSFREDKLDYFPVEETFVECK